MAVLVDSNVLLDLITRNQNWFDWSSQQIAHYGDSEELLVNELIVAEVSMSFATIEELDKTLEEARIFRQTLPWNAALLPGPCFTAYRRQGGTRRSPLPDFYIGAHAAVNGAGLLTRDARRYRTYFPKLRLIAP